MKAKIRIGCGAGFSGDRIEPALILTDRGNLDYLVLECLAERTIALAQKRKQQDPDMGYDPLLERRMDGLLPLLVKHKTRLITNMGAANPLAAGKKILEIAQKKNIQIKVAVVLGDDVFTQLQGDEFSMEGDKPLNSYGKLISANAYLGIDAIIPALETDAQVIITGRVADPSLFLAPMVYELGWDRQNFELLGKGTVLGHLLECAGQITGGYFADPVTKPVQGMEKLGHPFVDVFQDGSGIISKVEGTGGQVSIMTAKEQLLYEVIDPGNYITPDVNADFSTVVFEQMGIDKVRVSGGNGINRPKKLKVSVGYHAGYMGEGEISYAGAHAKERAMLAGEIIEKRIKHLFDEFRVDYIGLSALHGLGLSASSSPYEIRLRAVGKTFEKHKASWVGEEVEALYTNGPAGGGGARKNVQEVVGVVSTLLDRDVIQAEIKLFGS
ncbi:acyclic terpene utilization AtuA family protein [Fontibacter flavus]|uniref:Acyclic terpene utilization AtuA family protein n=1 Tax=Fontibacter flavus TaxID=654838 RepID=A0ABV6FVY8_9BACT